jgi:hypothetical protein
MRIGNPHTKLASYRNMILKIIKKTTFVLIGFLTLTSCNQLTSEEQMLQILQQKYKAFFNHQNDFSPEATISYLDSLLSLPQHKVLEIQYLQKKANALLKLGKTRAAIELLEELTKNEMVINGSFRKEIQKDLALAYLRLGEQDNCISNHSSESCIFPIQGKGIHQNTSGSERAIGIYESVLKEDPSDLESKWLLNIAYMTLGKYPGGVPEYLLIPNLDSDTTNEINPFEDIAADLGIDVKNMAGGSIMEDFDNDGYLDLVTSAWGLNEGMHYFKNSADGTFEDISETSKLKKFTGGLNMMQTDYNNDGLKDIFVTRGAWQLEYGRQPNSLFKNNGDGTFTDVTFESGLVSMYPTQTATWNDFNNDGWLDLFIGNESSIGNYNAKIYPCEFYLNNQDGTFTELAQKAHCNLTYYVKGVTSGDYNNDGWQDLFISTLNGEKFLLKNKGIKGAKVEFEDVTVLASLDKEKNKSFPTWFWDYDNDGWLDIFVGDYSFNNSLGYYAAAEHLNMPKENTGQACLYKNNRDGTFSNITKQSGLFKTAYSMGSNFGDIDNDGYLDMYLGTGNPNYQSLVPNKMFKNIGGQKFKDVTTSAKVGSLQKGHGVSFGDMDNDGDQDIYIEMGGAYIGDAFQSSFYLNPRQKDNNWICVYLEGTNSNRAAIGSRIKITFKEDGKLRSVYRDVNSGGSFGASPLRREIGLGKARIIDEIEIKWHGSGTIQIFKSILPNQFIRIKEGNNTVEKIHLKNFVFKRKTRHSLHCH